MARILAVIVAVVASFVLAETLTCNQCNYGILGFCLSNSEVTCSNTTASSCFTAKTVFSGVTNVGFNTQGCLETSMCNMTNNGSIFSVTYETKVECCSADKCNPVQLSGAPSTKMTFSAAIGVAVLASMWGSIL